MIFADLRQRHDSPEKDKQALQKKTSFMLNWIFPEYDSKQT
jgi:hypothetical protein